MKKIINFLIFGIVISMLASCALNEPDIMPSDDGAGRSTEPVMSSQTDVTPDGKTVISFAAVGDNLIHESIFLEAAAKASADLNGGDYFFSDMYADSLKSIIKEADISFVNQETPIVPERAASGYPSFNTPTEAGDTLVDMGFDVVNIATNHMLDMEGQCEGLRSSINYWNDKSVMMIGGYVDSDDYNTVRVMETSGKRIAFLSYTYGTNGNRLNPSSTELVVPYIDDEVIQTQVKTACANADAVVVSMHWGEENSSNVSAEQKRLAKLISDAGADVIIGHHTHTVQSVDVIESQTGNKTLVYYSLGNFISTQLQYTNLVGGLATFDLVFDKDGSKTFESVMLTPTITNYSADEAVLDSQDLATRSDVTVRLLKDYTEEMCKNAGAQVFYTFNLDSLHNIVTSAVAEEYLPEYMRK